MRHAFRRLRETFEDKKYFPMDVEEYPELRENIQSFFNRFTLPITAAFCVFGYAIYFGFFGIDDLAYTQWLLQNCEFCQNRYEGLQALDGVSGAVYIALLPWGLAATACSSAIYVIIYVHAWKRSRSYVAMGHHAIVGVLIAAVFSWICYEILIHHNFDFTGSNKSNAQFLTSGGIYPIFLGIGSGTVAYFFMFIAVYFIKYIKQIKDKINE